MTSYPPMTGSRRGAKSLPLLSALLGAAISACGGGSASTTSGDPATQGNQIPNVLATVDGDPITLQDLRARVGEQLDSLQVNYEKSRHQAIEGALQAEVLDRVLSAEAEKQGESVDELLTSEAGRDLAPTDSEVTAWYEANKARLAGRTLEQLGPQIAEYLLALRRQQVSANLFQKLREDWGVTLDLGPYRVPLHNEDAPARGADNAPVTLTEFSDFQCPYCGRLTPSLDRLREEMGDTVRVVFRQFPIPSLHPNAEKAAEASLCAEEQGEFWEMHDLMFAEQDRLSPDDLREKAERLELDVPAFDECMASGRVVDRIRQDQSEGRSLGVHGTPALFVNGIEVPGGAVPYEVIAAAVRDEVARQSR